MRVLNPSTFNTNSTPIWLWTCVRKVDFPGVLLEGVCQTPFIWCLSTRTAAVSCGSQTTFTLRVNTDLLDPSKLVRDTRWQKWVADYRRRKTQAVPPLDFVTWLAKLKKFDRPDIYERLQQLINTGNFQKSLTKDLAAQMDRVKWDHLWTYQGQIPVDALSIEWTAGFYISLQSISVLEEKWAVVEKV